MWDAAQALNIRVGLGESTSDTNGLAGMLLLSHSQEPFSTAAYTDKELKIRWLVNVAHLALSTRMIHKLTAHICLTAREIEVLKWTADGKTSSEIAVILAVSVNTVNFHIKNAVAKLQVTNKTAAVVRAAMLGLLN